MARSKRNGQARRIAVVYGSDQASGKLGISLGLSVPAAALMLLVYGTDAWDLIFAIGTVAVAVGVMYFIGSMVRSVDR